MLLAIGIDSLLNFDVCKTVALKFGDPDNTGRYCFYTFVEFFRVKTDL